MTTESLSKITTSKVNNKIVIGMTGKMDSVAVAYLLKKQGLEPIAVSVINLEKMMGKKEIKDGAIDRFVSADISITGSCHIENLNSIKNICDQLGIPFYATSAKDAFREDVLGRLITSRLSGEKFSPCISCHRLIIQTLIEKAKELDAPKIATGHYAKILSAQQGKQLVVGSSNDVKNDQSYLLAGLQQEELEKMLLPLSDMRKSDILRIVESLGLNFAASGQKSGDCFTNHPYFEDFLTHMSSRHLRKKGSVIDFKNDVFIADHHGYHIYTIGQTNLRGFEGNAVDREAIIVDIDPNSGHIYLGKLFDITYRLTVLKNFVADKFLDQSRPKEAYVKFNPHDEAIPCTIFFRTFNICVIQFKLKQYGRAPSGKIAVLYSRSGPGSKVLGHGQVASYSPFENMERLYETIDMADPVETVRNNKAKEDNLKLRF